MVNRDGLDKVTETAAVDALGVGAVVETPLGKTYVASSEWRGLLCWSSVDWPDDKPISTGILLMRARVLRVVSVR